MRSRSMLLAAFAASCFLVVIGGLAWACTDVEGGVDDSSGTPGSVTTYTGRYYAKNEPVEVRWNPANENSATAPLMTTAQANADGVVQFTVTIPEDEPGSYWIVVRGPGDGRAGGANFFRGAADYTIEGAATPNEPSDPPPPSQEPGTSKDPQPSNQGSKNPVVANDGRGPASGQTDGGTVVIAPQQEGTTTGVVATPGLVPARGDRLSAQRPEVVRLDPRYPANRATSPWSGFALSADTDQAPSLIAQGSRPPMSPFAVGAVLLGVGLVAMFAGFLVADIRRQRKVHVLDEANDGDISV